MGNADATVGVHLHGSATTGRYHASGGPSIGADRDISCKICRLVRGIGKLDARYTASAAIDRKCILGCETRSPVGPGEYRAGGAGSGDGQALAEHSCLACSVRKDEARDRRSAVKGKRVAIRLDLV